MSKKHWITKVKGLLFSENKELEGSIEEPSLLERLLTSLTLDALKKMFKEEKALWGYADQSRSQGLAALPPQCITATGLPKAESNTEPVYNSLQRRASSGEPPTNSGVCGPIAVSGISGPAPSMHNGPRPPKGRVQHRTCV